MNGLSVKGIRLLLLAGLAACVPTLSARAAEDHLSYTIPHNAVAKSTTTEEPAGDGCDRVVVTTTAYFLDGQKVGERIACEGSVLETPFKDGKKHGVSRAFLGNTLLRERPYRHGKLHGVCKQWNQDGRLLGSFRMNMGTGIVREWREHDGTLDKESHCKGGVLHLVREYRPNGIASEETPYKDGKIHGVVRTWWPSGRLLSETHYRGGRKHGTEKTWNKDGTFWRELRYSDGKPHGVWRWYHDNGKIQHRRRFRDGKMHGTFEQWDPQGRLLGSFEMKMGSGVLWTWDEGGNLIESYGYPECYLNGRVVDKDYYLKARRADPSLPPFTKPQRRGDR